MPAIRLSGIGKFIFIDENGTQIKDPSSIAYIKKNYDWKKTVYELSLELQKKIEDGIESAKNFHLNTPSVLTEDDVRTEAESLVCRQYTILYYQNESDYSIRAKAESEAKKFVEENSAREPVWKRKKVRMELERTKFNELVEFYKNKDKENAEKYYEEQHKIKEAEDKKLKEQYECEKNEILRKTVDDEVYINECLKKCIRDSAAITGDFKPVIKGKYSKNDDSTCTLVIDLPSKLCIEARNATISSSGKINVWMRPPKEIDEDWKNFCSSLIIFMTASAFNVNTAIKNVCADTYYMETDGATGRNKRKSFVKCCFDRESFGKINFERINPVMTVKSYSTAKKSSVAGVKSNGRQKISSAETVSAKFRIKNADEITKNSPAVIFDALKKLTKKYGFVIFAEENEKRFKSAVKDMLPQKIAEQELVFTLIREKAFRMFIEENTHDKAAAVFTQVFADNNISSSKKFLADMETLL